MIPKIDFPIEKLRLSLLYQDSDELGRARLSSPARGSLSKVSAAYHELYFPAPAADRPYVFSSMVLSMDGKMAFPDDPQGPVVASANAIDREGGLTDFWVLNVLRAHADAIVVGARTLKSEPEVVFTCLDADLLAERKELLGRQQEHPLTIVVSLDGQDVPLEHSIFSMPETQTILATCHVGGQYLQSQYGQDALMVGPFNDVSEVDTDSLARQIRQGLQAHKKVILMTGENEPDARVLLFCLRKIGVDYLLIESPTYTWLLMDKGMLDEFFVDYSTLYIGGQLTPGYNNGFTSFNHPHTKFLVVAMHQNSFLFTRQKIVYGLSTES